MLKRLFFLYGWLFLLILPLAVYGAQSPHIHGQATLTIILDQSTIKMSLKVPSISIVGFEHVASTPAEKDRLANALKTLETTPLFTVYGPKPLFRKPPIIPVMTKTVVTVHGDQAPSHQQNGHNHHDHHDDHDDHDDETSSAPDHSEYHIDVTGHVPSGASPSYVSTMLFDHFPEVHRIQVHAILNGASSMSTLQHDRRFVPIQ